MTTMTVGMTKVQAKNEFAQLLENTTGNTLRSELKADRVAVKQEWFNYVDMLLKDGIITERQADNWLFPWEAK